LRDGKGKGWGSKCSRKEKNALNGVVCQRHSDPQMKVTGRTDSEGKGPPRGGRRQIKSGGWCKRLEKRDQRERGSDERSPERTSREKNTGHGNVVERQRNRRKEANQLKPGMQETQDRDRGGAGLR